MRKIFVILFFFFSGVLVAQQSEQYSQYSFNNMWYNPAFIGTTKCLEFKAGTRLQWMGFRGAPRTSFASLQHTFKARNFHQNGKHAIGLYVEQDEIHITTRTYVKLGYAYHKKLSSKFTGGVGVYAGIQQYAINTAFSPNDPDPVLASASGSALKYPDIMPGILIYSNKVYYSFAVNQLYFKNIGVGGPENKQINQYYFGWGHKSPLGNWTFFKSFLLKANVMGPPALDLNMNFDYQNNIGFGLGYRVGEAVIAQLKLRIFESIAIGYAFDFPLNKIYGNYTHEFMISFSKCGGGGIGDGGSNKQHACPAYN
ncbi:MAG: PorP/SprF family type IX secretion system membrane protein [Flavobacteriales bacterium]|nr:MAG: type IX secretion system membrane protein PorP/SprF [Flavobacteriales bacterium]MBE7441211.1 PorP/SprF family type IX secretion system membrane protein [Flavobacteriales bacterium]MBX2960297.1 PorP/SprF family type IX secretion system membrane protein [Flavobacteriales bacterium]MCL4856137.1 PorP/SprF family type IX secretion system membrane protein [Flavobacteriales bacterium]HRN41225.1 PorP/SprF family type IX secretion system membrane protein [Vicingus sp.]